MRFYKNSQNETAKVMSTWARVAVMFRFETRFFPDMAAANRFLTGRGYTAI